MRRLISEGIKHFRYIINYFSILYILFTHVYTVKELSLTQKKVSLKHLCLYYLKKEKICFFLITKKYADYKNPSIIDIDKLESEGLP